MRPRTIAWLAAVAVAGAPALAPAAAPHSLTVEQAVALALSTNPRLAAARDRLRGAGDQATSIQRRMLPSVHLSEEYLVYNSAFSIPFMVGAPPIPVRNQITSTFVASADQPLLQLGRLNSEKGAQDETVAAARAQLAAFEADVREAVQSQYVRVFEAQALEQISAASVSELSEQVTVAKARLATGVITQADLLRIEVAVANARQDGLQAHSQGLGARAQLMQFIGLPAEEAADLTLVEPTALLAEARRPQAPLGTLLPQARQRRPEVAQQAHLTLAADHQASVAGYSLLPDLDFEAAYLRVDGQKFAKVNSAYIGVRAQWAIWEWGATDAQWRAAKAQAAAARRDAEAMQRQIESEVDSSAAQSDAARGAVEAAEKAIASAEEAYRVTEAQVKAGTATTTDLLTSQAALTQARLNLTRAQYELALARISLARAAGS
jgi:outer membrane protein TolC